MAKTEARRVWTHEAVKELLKEFPGLKDPEEAVRQKARALVEEARGCHWSGPPFDPEMLASIRGITVVEGTPALGHDALIRPRAGHKLEIVWNPSPPPTRRRFSICHEIAHTLFPDAYDVVHYRDAQREKSDPHHELEALCDIAAAEFLLPLAEFKRDLKALGISLDTMDELRDRYEASREAVLLRMVAVTSKPIAIATLSWRHKPKEERAMRQGRFGFADAPRPKLRIDLMAQSDSFAGPRLPVHKSIPDESCAYKLLEIGAPRSVSGIETWGTDRADLPECHVEAMRIPPGPDGPDRIAVLLQPKK